MQSTAETTIGLSSERSNKVKQLFRILDADGASIHSFSKYTIEEAEAYYINYCVRFKLQLVDHMLMAVGA